MRYLFTLSTICLIVLASCGNTREMTLSLAPRASIPIGDYAESVGSSYGLSAEIEQVFGDPQGISLGVGYTNYALKDLELGITDESYYSISAHAGYKYIIPNFIRLSGDSSSNPLLYLGMNVGVFNIRDSWTMDLFGQKTTTTTSDTYLGLTPSAGIIYPLSGLWALVLDLGYTAINTKPDMFTYFNAGLGLRYMLP